MNGQPCVRHMRLTVRRVLEALATHPDSRGDDGRPLEEGAVPIAKGAGGVVWIARPDGAVHGRAVGGVYGPDVGVVTWLGDQIDDLEYAWDHARGTGWGDRVLGR
jgi:hypothetical protein